MRLSVHIATRNRAGELYGLLTSLYMQTFKDWDLILLDESENPSINQKYIYDIISRMKLEGHGVKYIVNTLYKGISAARNLCLKNDDWNDWCVRIDDDSVCEEDYLKKLVQTLETCAGKKVGAVGGLVPPLGSPPMFMSSEKMTVFNRIEFNEEAGTVSVADDGGYNYTPNKILPSHHLRSSFMFNKAAALEVGGFPEDQGGMIGWREETKFSMLLVWAGYELITNTNIICWHEQAMSGGGRQSNYPEYRDAHERHFVRWALRKWKQEGKKYGESVN